jgi:hypothetical protein
MMKALNALVAAAAVSCVMASSAANAVAYTIETYTLDFSVDDNFLYFDNARYAWEDIPSSSRFKSDTDVYYTKEVQTWTIDEPPVGPLHIWGYQGASGNPYSAFYAIGDLGGSLFAGVSFSIDLNHWEDGTEYSIFAISTDSRWELGEDVGVTLDKDNSWLSFSNGEIHLRDLTYTRIDYYAICHRINAYECGSFRTTWVDPFYTGQLQSVHLVFSVPIPVPVPVPEPETYAMLLAGLGIVGAVARRRSKRG